MWQWPELDNRRWRWPVASRGPCSICWWGLVRLWLCRRVRCIRRLISSSFTWVLWWRLGSW
ncbi:unnamed protein product [Linum tenue]|uniref:Uncharacterized protein n=1 Tax=Linum tenue TaxID=586396 RepID=A0AAV0R185_9ROSI|nr:unnamed protein product [Linum tenue]CAI0551462.1 unnamed protein product [Linum tenue]